MEFFSYLGLILGVGSLLTACLKTSILLRIVDTRSLNNWKLLRFLIVAFMLGYLVCLGAIATKPITFVEVIVVIIFLSGSLFVLLVVNSAFQDIQLIRSSKDLLQEQNNQLQKLNNQLDSFLYSTAHDLRAPLTTILGLVDLGKRGVGGNDKEDYFSMIHKTVNSMDFLLKEIIGFTKNKHLEIQLELVNPKLLVESVLKELEPIRKIKIDTQLYINFHNEAWLDIYRFHSILYNLISNSYRFFDPLKQLSWVKIIFKEEGNELQLSVIDNGLGIEKDYQDKVFEMFFRGSQNSNGSGLGLYLTREIVLTLGGSIGLTSRPGIGTEINIRFPNPLSPFRKQPTQIK